MSNHRYKSLTISGKPYTEKALTNFAQSQISRKEIPPWESSFYQFILDWVSNSDKVLIKTSGSTGKAKWMEVAKEKMVQSAQMTGQFFELQNDDKALLCLPTDFIAGKMMIVRSFVFGLNLFAVKPSGNPLQNLKESFAFAALTPMQVYQTLKIENGFQRLNQIQKLIVGGGEINQALLNDIRDLKNCVYHTYGMTETLTHVAMKKLNGENPESFFHALKGIKFEKDDRSCLVISAPHISEKKFVTNDIVDLIDEQSFIFNGRYDNVINSGGVKISPEFIERKLSSFIEGRYIIAGIPDEKLGQKVILIVEGEKKPTIDFSKTTLLKYEIPKQVFSVDSFPETENGKIIRKEVLMLVLKKCN